MKFFTKELWGNISDDSVYKKWQDNIVAYGNYIDTIKPYLSKKAVSFFTKVSLHDSILLSFSAGDSLSKFMNVTTNFIEIRARKYETGYDYKLRYTKVSKCSFDFPSDKPMNYWPDIFSFGEWMYDELSMIRNDFFRHKILLSTGAELSIEFRHFTYSRHKY